MFLKVKIKKKRNLENSIFFLELRQCSLHVSSIESSTSQNHCTTTMSLNSASGTSSLMNNTEDNDIIELQNRLQFTKNIQVRKICKKFHFLFYIEKIFFKFSLFYLLVEIVMLFFLVYFYYKMKTKVTLR
jgi:hypothetical protein